MVSKVLPIGLDSCDVKPETSVKNNLAPEVFMKISLQLDALQVSSEIIRVSLKVLNRNDTMIPAWSNGFASIGVAWRALDSQGTVIADWDSSRKALASDIPAKGERELLLKIPRNSVVKGGSLELSFVHEHQFWAHDLGVQPLKIPWPALMQEQGE